MSELTFTSVRALVFDVDGTLCDSASLHYKAWSQVVGQLGVPVPTWQDYVKECLRGQRRFEDLLEPQGAASSLVLPDLHKAKSHLFSQLALASLKPFTGVIELWSQARALGLRLAIVSTARRQSVEDTVKILHLPSPDVIISREDVEPHVKPDPTGYRLATQRLALVPVNCVAFEDSPSGIQAATLAGLPCLAMISSVFSSEEQSGARLLLDSFEDVTLIPDKEGSAKLLVYRTVP